MPKDFAPVKAIIVGLEALPLYPVDDPNAAVAAVAVRRDRQTLSMLDEQGNILWSQDLGPGEIFGVFDFNQDGWIDLEIARAERLDNQWCGIHPMYNRWLEFIDGQTGQLYDQAIRKLPDMCWHFEDQSITYPTPQWAAPCVLYGEGTGTLKVSPYYAEAGWFFDWRHGQFFSNGAFFYPSTAAFDDTYPAAQPNPYDRTHAYIPHSDVAMGLIVPYQGQFRLLFFTSARVLQYKVGPLASDQLLVDHPFLNGGRTDIAGRNKGLVVRDPYYPDYVVLLAGVDTSTVLNDRLAHQLISSPWAHIERYVTVYTFVTNVLEDRFYSYAHDNHDGNQYQQCVVYPPNPFLPGSSGQPSRMAYNVYANGHWFLHISQPGTTADLYRLQDVFLWDIRDVDGDGRAELVISPVRFPSDP